MLKGLLQSVKRQINRSIQYEVNQTIDDAIHSTSKSIKKGVSDTLKSRKIKTQLETDNQNAKVKMDTESSSFYQPLPTENINPTHDDGSIAQGIENVGTAVRNFEAGQGDIAAGILRSMGGIDENGNVKGLEDIPPEQQAQMLKAFMEFSKSQTMSEMTVNLEKRSEDIQETVIDSVERIEQEKKSN